MFGKTRTKRQTKRFELIQERGCVPCYLEARMTGRLWCPEPCDIHHTDGQDHDRTYGNCPWHHRGVPKNQLTTAEMTHIFGPSMARSPFLYRERYGREHDLLAVQNEMLIRSVTDLAGPTF